MVVRFDLKTRGLGAVLALGCAILCGVLVGIFGSGRFTGRYAVPAQHSESPVPAPAPIVLPPPSAPAPPIVTVAPPRPTVDTVGEDHDRDRIAAAIARATRKALDRGEPVRWHKAGQSGYIVVSDAQRYDDRTCRNVSATVIDDDGETRSGAHLWCLAGDDDDWQPAR